MSSFRDRFNPEAVHFPSRFQSRFLVVCGIVITLLCLLPAYVIEQPLAPVVIDTALSLAALAFLLSSWPDNLMTDQFGLSAKSPLRFRRVFIPWKEVASVDARREFSGFLSGFGVKCEALAVYGANGQKVVHGPQHSDRERFLHELEIHGVVLQADPGEEVEGE